MIITFYFVESISFKPTISFWILPVAISLLYLYYDYSSAGRRFFLLHVSFKHQKLIEACR